MGGILQARQQTRGNPRVPSKIKFWNKDTFFYGLSHAMFSPYLEIWSKYCSMWHEHKKVFGRITASVGKYLTLHYLIKSSSASSRCPSLVFLSCEITRNFYSFVSLVKTRTVLQASLHPEHSFSSLFLFLFFSSVDSFFYVSGWRKFPAQLCIKTLGVRGFSSSQGWPPMEHLVLYFVK